MFTTELRPALRHLFNITLTFLHSYILTINWRIGIRVPITVKVVGEFFLVIQDLVLAGITQVNVCENAVLRVEEAVWRTLLK